MSQARTPTPTRPPAAPRARPGVEEQRRRVLEAAWRVLGRRALEDVRVEDVLVEADVSRQTFYRCFAGLEPLFAAIQAELERVLRDAVGQALASADTPDALLRSVLGAVFDAAATAGPTLAAIAREEERPGSPFEGARARRQAALTDLLRAWFQARVGLDADPWRVRAVLMAVHALAVAVCDPARAAPDDVARARDAAWTLAQGLLLVEGARAGLWDLTPRAGSPPPPALDPHQDPGSST